VRRAGILRYNTYEVIEMYLFESNEELKTNCFRIKDRVEEHYGVKVLLLGISGSHMWGLSRPESDVDIRGIYVKPLRKVLSLNPGRDTIEGTLFENYDIQLYEIGKAFSMLNNNNGNLVELILSPTVYYQLDCDFSWRTIARSYVTQRLYHYYKGYHQSQKRRAAKNRGGKALLYAYREIMQGIYLMKTGKIVHNFEDLRNDFERVTGFYPSLLDTYLPRSQWSNPVTPQALKAFEVEWDALSITLEVFKNNSELPEMYDGEQLLSNLLYTTRLRLNEGYGYEDKYGGLC
jgi:uncharacterized protein